MDALSEALAAMRLGNANSKRVKESGAWGMRFPAYRGSGFHVVLSGEGWLLTRDAPPRRLQPGDVAVVPAGAEHALSSDVRPLEELPMAEMGPGEPAPGAADFEFLCGGYQLEHGRVHHYLASLPGAIVISPDYDHDPQIRDLTRLLGANTSPVRSGSTGGPEPGAAATRSALFDLLLIHLLRQWLAHHDRDSQSPGSPQEWAHVTDPAIADVLRVVHDDPLKVWTVSDLGAVAGFSRTEFTRRFSSQVGTAPRSYLISLRLLHGARMLRETTAPLATVAHQVGYANEFAFGAAFRREFGISPGRFRATTS